MPEQELTIQTRLLLLSDTHSTNPLPKCETLPASDVLIHAGDLTDYSTYNEHLSTFSLVSSAPAPLKLVIPGNHDLQLDAPYWVSRRVPAGMKHGTLEDKEASREKRQRETEKVRELWTGNGAREKGIEYLEEGQHVFQLANGAEIKVWTSPYTPEFCGWGFAYPRSEDRFNGQEGKRTRVEDFPGIDVLVTHGPPKGMLDRTTGFTSTNAGCKSLWTAVRRAKPRLHVFGHIHEGYGAVRMNWLWGERKALKVSEKGDGEVEVRNVDVSSKSVQRKDGDGVDGPLNFGMETLFVNAANMNEYGAAVNAPWIVDLDLPLGKRET